MIKLSKTSKLDGIMSWSLQAIETCAGSIDPVTKDLVPACQGCYATQGFYVFAPAKNARAHNKQDFKRTEWVNEMVSALDSQRYFRWFDSGDIVSIDLAHKILEVMERTPWVKHWLPTRMHKFSKYLPILEKMQELPNVVVRYSSDSVQGEIIAGQTTSTIFSDDVPAGAKECEAYKNAGKCSGCRACYSKDVPVIAYKAHGAKMAKVIKILQVKGV